MRRGKRLIVKSLGPKLERELTRLDGRKEMFCFYGQFVPANLGQWPAGQMSEGFVPKHAILDLISLPLAWFIKV